MTPLPVACGREEMLASRAVERRVVWSAAAGLLLTGVIASSARATVMPVPPVIAELQAPKDETHLLRSPAGATLGEQRFRLAVAGARLAFDVATHFTSGEEWDEHGEMDVADGFRSRRFDRTMRSGSRVVQEQHVDFAAGTVAWLVDGVHSERTMTFAPDTYIGPMLAFVLATVPEHAPPTASFQVLSFRPDPIVVTVRADAVEDGGAPPSDSAPPFDQDRTPPAAKLRVRADLGPVKNVLFASFIHTHYFWFTRSSAPEFVAFEGKLTNGLEVVMTPETPLTTTAHAP